MKEKKVNKSGELSNNELNSVAGGNRGDLVIQQMMHMDGFKEEWLDGAKDGQAFDGDFVEFLDKNYGLKRTAKLVGRYGDQKNMFKK